MCCVCFNLNQFKFVIKQAGSEPGLGPSSHVIRPTAIETRQPHNDALNSAEHELKYVHKQHVSLSYLLSPKDC